MGAPETKRRVLVTGATSGIGLAAARRFAELGWEVFATARSAARADELAADLSRQSGGLVRGVVLDVDRPTSIAACADVVRDQTSGHGVDVVVNNAGFARASPILDLSDEDLRAHFDTNVFGAVAVTRAFLPGMLARRSGRIVNVSSSGGRVSLPFVGAYHAAKFAIEALSDAMRWELAPFGVRVSVIEPGPVRTPFVDKLVGSTGSVPPGSPYAPALERVERLQRLAERHMIEPAVVVRDIIHAAEARRPRARYVEPRLLGLVLGLVSLAPGFLVDPIVSRLFGLRGLARAATLTQAGGANA